MCLIAHAFVYRISIVSFLQILVKGSVALKAMEWLCTAPMDKPNNSCTYTLALNDKAGIENDFTVTRLAEDEFFIVTGLWEQEHILV